MWDKPRSLIERHGYRTLAPNQRGFGSQPLGDEAPSVDLLADDVARLLDASHIDRAVMVGSSMGGYVGLAFARRHRNRLMGLVLIACRASADDAQARAAREAFAVRIQDDNSRPTLLAATIPMLVGITTRERRPDVLKRVIADAQAANPASVAWAQRAIAARPDSFDVIRSIDAPTIVIAGSEDELVRADEAEMTASATARGRLTTIPETGHLPPLETPDQFGHVLLEFLSECYRGHDSEVSE